MKTNRLLSAILLFGMLTVGATCFAQVNNWNIRYIGENKFVVEREKDNYEENVYLVIQHISEIVHNDHIYKKFSPGRKSMVFEVPLHYWTPDGVDKYAIMPRQSLLQLVDIGGMELATTVFTWPEEPSYDYNPIVAPDIYQHPLQIPLIPADSVITVTDESNRWATRCFFDYENSIKQWVDLDYLRASDFTEIRMYVTFEAKEVDDGYQYVQISPGYVGGWDEDDPVGSGNPGFANEAFYKAGFEHKHGSKNTDWQPYCFPVRAQPDTSGVVPNAWSDLGNPVGQLHQQYFSHHYKHTYSGVPYRLRADDGSFIIPLSVRYEDHDLSGNYEGLFVRFTASGSGEDTWNVRNVVANVELIDTVRPHLSTDVSTRTRTHQDCVVIDNKWGNDTYEWGISYMNTVCLIMKFNEIVIVEGEAPRIECSWGTFDYIGGSGSNVLSFKGQIVNNQALTSSGTLVFGPNTTIKDLAGNPFEAGTIPLQERSLDPIHKYNIKYSLSGGSLPKDAKKSYTYLSDSFSLKEPTHWGCTFEGWSGTDIEGIVPTVTVPKHSYGTRHFKAHWRDNWGMLNGATGTSDNPYLISDVEGFLMLETFCDDIKDKYFRLEADIDLTGVDFNGISKFYGHLDGNGHVIRGFRISNKDNYNVGLIGVIDDKGGIKNLIVDDAIVQGENRVGVLVGLMHGGLGESYLQNCLVMNSCVEGKAGRSAIVGYCNHPQPDNITNNYYLNCVANDSIVDNIGLSNVDDAGHFTKLDKDSLEVFYNNGENQPRIEELLAANQPAQAPARALSQDGRLKAFFAGRKMHRDDMWNTFCIPFDIRDINAKDNEGRYVWPIHGADLRELVDATIDNGTLTLTFSDTLSSIEAGKPYFIKWTQGDEICNPFFEKITITNADPIPFINTNNNVVFVGDYDALNIDSHNENAVMVLRENTISYIDPEEQPYQLGAFRCRFYVVPDEEGEPSVSEVVINALPTGIKEVQEATTLHIAKAKKVFRDGKLYIILPNGTCFDITGKQVNL